MKNCNCTNCGNAIYDAQWGEYKCAVSKHTVYGPGRIDITIDCEHHIPGNPKESKNNADYEANLQDC